MERAAFACAHDVLLASCAMHVPRRRSVVSAKAAKRAAPHPTVDRRGFRRALKEVVLKCPLECVH